MDVSEEVIRRAFALSRARGAGLLSLLGDFNVWRGSLEDMRDDSPRTEHTDTATPPITGTRNDLADVLRMSRAIEMLDDDCRATLLRACDVGESTPTAATNRNSDAPDRERISACKSRLITIYTELQDHATGPATPEWVAEREHAVVTASHGRHRG